MRKRLWLGAMLICLVAGQSARVSAQGRAGRGGEAPAAGTEEASTKEEESSVTEHSITIGGKVIPYKATGSTILLKNDAGEPIGLMYSVAYTRSDVKDLSTRPISFFYNGGPGSATMWLHMGAFGPRRVATTEGEFTAPAPYKLVDNTESLIDKTDMVFIDAMGTGYSHIVGKGAPPNLFYGIGRRHGRVRPVSSTLYQPQWALEFAEVSDGRKLRHVSVGGAGKLFAEPLHTMHLNGIVLISSVLDLSFFAHVRPSDDRVYVYICRVMRPVAWYHKALKNRPANLEGFIEEARAIREGEYADGAFQRRQDFRSRQKMAWRKNFPTSQD